MKFAAFRKAAALPISVGNLFRKELIRYQRDKKEALDLHVWKNLLQSSLEVQQGPFVGMVYPGFVSFNSARLPKLFGTYESEIYDDLERLLQLQPEIIIDIGAADGYYAVGLARRLPDTPVRCFDLNPEALAFCGQMAAKNKVKNLSIETLFHPAYFEELTDKKGLLIVDIDGGEKPLFTPAAVSSLKQSSLIIETHDYLDATITSGLIRLFSPTHNIKIISYRPDKVTEAPVAISSLSWQDRKTVMRERIVDNKWLIIEPK